MNTLWESPDLDAALRRLWDEGYSCGQIALRINAECGTAFSRNAIIGVANRKGLPKRVRPDEPRLPRKRKPRPPRPMLVTVMPKIFVAPPLPPPPVDDAAIPIAQRKTLMELWDGCCHWPVGEPGTEAFFYCGGPAVAGRPYCAAHCARA